MSHEEAVKILLSLGLASSSISLCPRLITETEYERARLYDVAHSPLGKFLDGNDKAGYDAACAEAIRTIIGSN